MLNIEIISPQGIVFQSEAKMAVLPSVQGEIGIMEDHEPMVLQLKAGEKISVYNQSDSIVFDAVINGGFAEVHGGKRLVVLID